VRRRGEQRNRRYPRKYHLAEIDGLLPPFLHGAEYKQNGICDEVAIYTFTASP
jgi:hypothetical protein